MRIDVATADGRSLSANLGTGRREIGICDNCYGIGIAWPAL